MKNRRKSKAFIVFINSDHEENFFKKTAVFVKSVLRFYFHVPTLRHNFSIKGPVVQKNVILIFELKRIVL